MRFTAIIAIAFAALVSANCEGSDSIFCAPGMGHCLDPNNCKRSVGHGFTSVARDVIPAAKVENAE
jgi:hypothetical protein